VVKGVTTRAVIGIGSAQSFGAVKTAFTRQVGGVSTAQSFGVPHPRVSLTVSGVGSAQAFGTIVASTSQHIALFGVSSAQAFGLVTAFVDWLHDLVCVYSPSEAICDNPTICGTEGLVCGGTSYIDDLDCISSSDPAVLNEFLVGQKPVGGWANFTEGLDCIESLIPAICDNPTICGAYELVCGGLSFVDELVCAYSPDPTVLNEFLVGQRLAGGPDYAEPAPDPIVLDLQPAGCA
jgi:hypothetical protein